MTTKNKQKEEEMNELDGTFKYTSRESSGYLRVSQN